MSGEARNVDHSSSRYIVSSHYQTFLARDSTQMRTRPWTQKFPNTYVPMATGAATEFADLVMRGIMETRWE